MAHLLRTVSQCEGHGQPCIGVMDAVRLRNYRSWYMVIYTTKTDFYRAMHFSAKRGIAIACRLSVGLSVRPSVCDVGELRSNRLEFFQNISPLVSLGCSLFATPT